MALEWNSHRGLFVLFIRRWDGVYLPCDPIVRALPVFLRAPRSSRRSALVSVCHRLHPRCLQTVPTLMIHWCWCLQSLQNPNPMIHYCSVLIKLLSSSVSRPHRLHRRLHRRARRARASLRCSHRVSPCHRLPGRVHRCVLARSILPGDAGKETVEMAFVAVFPSSLMSIFCV